MKLWTLMENMACREDLSCEHGLSLYIEACGRKILFDAGQTAAFADNAERLGVDLKAVEFAVLSHGHYDHGGGMMRFFEVNDHAKCYVNQYAFGNHRHGERYIGIDPALKDTGRIVFVTEEQKVGEGLTLSTSDRIVYPIDDGGLSVEEGGVLRPEDYRHEQYLLIEENGKRILVSGCSHRGILNIAGQFRPDVLIGGFHFMNVTEEKRLRQAAEVLLSYPTHYYTGHCTGLTQYEFMKAIMGNRLESLSTGMLLDI